MPDIKAVVDSSIIGVKKEKYVTDFDCNSARSIFLIL